MTVCKSQCSDTATAKLGRVGVVIAATAHQYGISEEELLGSSREAEVLIRRHVAMYLAVRSTGLSKRAIGRAFGVYHTTILDGMLHVLDCMQRDPDLKRTVAQIAERIDGAGRQQPCGACLAAERCGGNESI